MLVVARIPDYLVRTVILMRALQEFSGVVSRVDHRVEVTVQSLGIWLQRVHLGC